MTLPFQHLVRPALITTCLLSVPLVAMQFTAEVNWTLSDFVVAGGLIFGTGLAYQLLASRAGSLTYRLAVGVALAAGFLSLWANLAVGIIGSGPNPANLMFGAVYLTAFVGAFLARLRPQALARTMLAAALTQFLAPLAALLFWQPEFTPDVTRGFVGNLLFVGMWLASAFLFRKAAGPRPDSGRVA
ncbi:hypothetical protein [Hymenobacter cellulosilyticus]|uniref:Uncharacterized protein n=1 Tax=Hymenobacter cellulosilyticus TaxID=2932248 RepID=A0A8T9PYG3_9BACT|nr:hypothetical protein [Hymenobacter cellulosilyticus]UOQ70107.1 hypothetical protein MUN79_15155 [Hymenobacter cellulosilyticus]